MKTFNAMESNNNTQPQQPIVDVWWGHYHSLIQALTVAMQHCWVWRKNDTKQPITVKELYDYALRYDVDHPLQMPQFFLVTREGAIGFSEGYEYLTKWLYIPMEAGPKRDKLIDDMRWSLKAERAGQEAVEKAIQAMKAAKEARAAQPQQTQPPTQPQWQQTQQPQSVVRCPRCGEVVQPGMRFCTNCGGPLT